MDSLTPPQPIQPMPQNTWCLDDLAGTSYVQVLDRLHTALQPRTYFEIGVETGETLALARCPSVAVDPQFSFIDLSCVQRVLTKPSVMFFQTTSDDFFSRHRPDVLLGQPVELAFLDGMHRCEYLLRDFINTERCCRNNAIIALHDCLPVELPMTSRSRTEQAIDERRQNMWTGDVWRTALLLKRRRPELSFLMLDAAPTGLMLITNLDPANRRLEGNYNAHVAEMLTWSLEDIGLPDYHHEMEVQSTHRFERHEDLTTRFWL